jgi:hypothetical protein
LLEAFKQATKLNAKRAPHKKRNQLYYLLLVSSCFFVVFSVFKICHEISSWLNQPQHIMQSNLKKVTGVGLLVTLGIIFGDIGTSPLYVFKSIIGEREITDQLVYGAISCVFWTLTLQTTFKYILLTLQADNKGEGGIFSLYALV